MIFGEGIGMEAYREKQLIEFVRLLGGILGNNIEIVLHIIEEEHSYIAAIENGYISGRTEDSPLTELALSFIKNGVYIDNQYVKNYRGITKDNKQIRASTFFLKDGEGNLEAMLCFNIDVTKIKELSNEILLLANLTVANNEEDNGYFTMGLDNKSAHNSTLIGNNHDGEFIEYFSESLYDFFHSIVPEENIADVESLKLDQKIEVVQQLHDRGYFEVKGAVAQVAKLLKVSEPSVYRYLKQIEH